MDNGQAILDSGTRFTESDTSAMNGAGEPHPMALLLEEFPHSLMELQVGDIRSGTVVEKRSNELLIDIGFKSEGLVTGREIDRVRDMLDTIEIGSEISVFVLREDKDGIVQLSIGRALAEADWQHAEEMMESQAIIEGEATAHNRGGVIIKLGQVRGFVPASQLAAENHPLPPGGNNDNEESRWMHLIGKTLMLKVIDLDRQRNRLILSERLAMREWRRKQKEELLANLKEGDVYEGVISSIADFGAFVNLGGADGLIHLSELSWNRIRHPSEVVKVGDEVKVQILTVDNERNRIGLSLRRLQQQPWDVIHDTYEVGQIVTGKITKLVNFGAFARLDESGIEGLIHISELSDNRVTHPKDIVSEGEEHELRIIRIDTEKRRMGLSLKQAQPVQEQVEIDWQIAPSGDDADDGDQSELVAQAMDVLGMGDGVDADGVSADAAGSDAATSAESSSDADGSDAAEDITAEDVVIEDVTVEDLASEDLASEGQDTVAVAEAAD